MKISEQTLENLIREAAANVEGHPNVGNKVPAQHMAECLKGISKTLETIGKDASKSLAI